MSLHKENAFEAGICEYLADHGWLYNPATGEASDAAKYDRERALFPEDLVAWVKASQPEAWETLTGMHGGEAGGAGATKVLLDRLRVTLDQPGGSGTLGVLRKGFDVLGLKQAVSVAQFRPALAMNPDIETRYEANRLRVVRQVRYSKHSEKSIDLVLFLNGLPMATVELKTDFTQDVQDAVDQYRLDRLPREKGREPEPLLSFPGGALVHFAVSNQRAKMTTKLEGPATTFLPFDRGDDGGAGNPVDEKGHPTRYLWEEVWERESWLDILGRYLVAERDDKKRIKKVIFPRYHQLDATRKLVDAVRAEGAGGRYLIQHSAGSGKTNSIAWSAHFLADLHVTGEDGQPKKVFDTVLVVSDRNVIDGQLQEAIDAFERTSGVVATVTGEGGSKSGELAEALSGGKKVVVCTIQTFPFAMEQVRELSATQGKRFCVIADEAHSSQTGEAAAKLKQVLAGQGESVAASAAGSSTGEEGANAGDADVFIIDSEEALAAFMAARAGGGARRGITYVAFTATPKAKTLELFGNRPKPEEPAGPGNLPEPFHVYSMRQAIEEGFILDVLENYITYSMAFRLAQQGADGSQHEVERSEAVKRLLSWVKLHPYNISQKVKIVVEHFRETVAPLLDGKAKAMVVVGSRLEAVRWKLAIDKYIAEHRYGLGTMVAFSGEVEDEQSGSEPFRETSPTMNPGLRGRDIREAFNDDEYRILLVANKFQTGFDQPLLCAMYVDKRLAGIQAVQTLSRLNRCYPGKDTTYVLDFANKADEVLEAFRAYYATATLEDVTDPNLVLDLRNKLDATGFYDEHAIERVVNVVIDPASKQKDLQAAIAPVADRLLKTYSEAQQNFREAEEVGDEKGAERAKGTMDALRMFRSDANTYLRAYAFLSQIFDYSNTAYEKRSIFFRHLVRLLKFGREREGVDLSQIVLTHHNLANRGKQRMQLDSEETPTLPPLSEAGSGQVRDKEKAYLDEIIEKVNDLFTGELSDNDKLVYVKDVLKGKLLESEVLTNQAASNTKEQFAASPDLHRELLNAIINALDAHSTMSTQALNSPTVQAGLKDVLLGPSQLYEELRRQSRASG